MDAAPHMSRETLEQTIAGIIAARPNQWLSIHWFGGEPLLRWGLISHGMDLFAAAIAAAIAEGRIDGATYGVTTNGSLVTDAMAERMAADKVEVFVSIDSPEEINDLSRHDRLGHGTYSRAVQGYRKLVSHGVRCWPPRDDLS